MFNLPRPSGQPTGAAVSRTSPATTSATDAPSSTAASRSPAAVTEGSAYRLRLADSAADLRAAQALRFDVFNLELGEGLLQSYDTGLDADEFDAVCDHLLVESAATGQVVGTYRLQTGLRARAGLGYYSAGEFDFSPFEAQRPLILELGRACIHQQHRQFAVLNLLWRGIAAYAHAHGARYLLGCSSLTSQDPQAGAAVYARLQPQLAPLAWQTLPLAELACPLDGAQDAAPQGPLDTAARKPPAIPRLMATYLALGAAVCGPPAIDRQFKTIDFLTWADLASPTLQAMLRRARALA